MRADRTDVTQISSQDTGTLLLVCIGVCAGAPSLSFQILHLDKDFSHEIAFEKLWFSCCETCCFAAITDACNHSDLLATSEKRCLYLLPSQFLSVLTCLFLFSGLSVSISTCTVSHLSVSQTAHVSQWRDRHMLCFGCCCSHLDYSLA